MIEHWVAVAFLALYAAVVGAMVATDILDQDGFSASVVDAVKRWMR